MHQWNPDDYEKHSSAQKKWGGALIEKLQLSGDEHVLDIGCGDGGLTVMIAARLPRGAVTGIDLSCEMIAHAQSRYPTAKYLTCRFACMDAREMVYESLFDVAFSNAALHWIQEQDLLLGRVFSALKPGGRLLFQMGGYGNAAGFFAVARTLMAEHPWKDVFSGFSPGWKFCSDEEYTAMLECAGLTPVRVELIPVDMVHGNRQELEGWIRTTWLPFLERLPDSGKEEFITDLTDHYLASHPPDREGRTCVKMVRLEVEARKKGGT
jgi:trans-aconitate 2-methyltransferase